MPKMSAHMIRALRELARGNVIAGGPTRAALLRRGLVEWVTADTGRRYADISDAGRAALQEIDCPDVETAETMAYAERGVREALRGVSAEDAQALIRACPDDEDERGAALVLDTSSELAQSINAVKSGPVVRLTPPRAPTHMYDAEVLQLLAMLDGGARVARRLFQPWQVLDSVVPVDPARLDNAAKHAAAYGLAVQVPVRGTGWYELRAEPVHLDNGNGTLACGIVPSFSSHRHRWTADPSKVTHDRCKS